MDNQNSRKYGKLNGWGVKGKKKQKEREGENQRDELEIAVAVGIQRDGSTKKIAP